MQNISGRHLLTINENYWQHSTELGNCQDGYYADIDSSAFEYATAFFSLYFIAYHYVHADVIKDAA